MVSKLFLKVISILYNCRKRIKTVGNLIRGYIRGSKRIKKGKISMEFEEINEILQELLFDICKIVNQNL